jgi:1,2-diacylglycerol 3-alpha-glucosyltransferase
MPIKILLPVVKTNTGSYSFILRLADGLKKYSDFDVEVVEYLLICEIVPWLMGKNFSKKRYDIILANSPYAFRFRDIADKLIVVELHSIFNNDFYANLSFPQRIYNRLIMQSYVKASFSVADHAVAISHFTDRDVRERFPNIPTSMIHCWVEVDRFSMSQPLAESGRDSDKVFELLCVGSLSARKGAHLLPGLASALGPGFRIKCVSKDVAFPFSEVPENLVLLSALSFDELIQTYQACDAVISLSSFEGFGYTLVEALSCGKPVAAFDIGPFREVLPENLHAYLARKNDLADFARRCRLLAEDVSGEKIDPKSLRMSAEEKFSAEPRISEYTRLFRGLVEKV